ncbi:hypothetical protein GIB67_023723 [Kingdonia uniflora]|uniref:Transposase n=1 Tax=Kingdonia uniflora TaxID=39325 RepID=A0A7J7MGD7_9MAGN|nr:hypothetical protein GIB67_023723 [Kingdonia uniflora]
MDKTWRFQPRASKVYEDEVLNFLDFAISPSNEHTSTKIRCPCKDCKNFRCLSSEEVYDHLVKLSGGDTMDQRNLAKKMTPVQIDITRKAKCVVENLGTTNNLNHRGLRRTAQPEIVSEIVQDRLWTMIKQNFIVPDEARKLALMTMGKDWRKRKVQKRKVIDIEDDLKQALVNYPEDVPYDQWEVFAKQCTTSEYKDQIDAGEVDLTVLFGPERTGRQENHIPSRPVKCKLFCLTPSNVGAIGHWYNEEPTCKVHNVHLGIGMSKVSIQIALKKDVPLAKGNNHLKTIGDPCGSFVAWPTPFIVKE